MVAPVEDIMADGWKFDTTSSSNKLNTTTNNKVSVFEKKANFYKVLTNAVFDLFITGNAYILKLSVDEEKLASILTELTKTIAKSMGVKIEKNNIYKFVNQDLKIPNDLQLLKASTMTINFDKTAEIISYQQRIAGDGDTSLLWARSMGLRLIPQ